MSNPTQSTLNQMRDMTTENTDSKEEEPSTGCGFHEPYFGASYPDGICIDGYIWDLDSCDERGGPLFSGGYEPCPDVMNKPKTVEVQYIEKGRFQGGEEDTSIAKIKMGEECLVIKTKDFEALWEAAWKYQDLCK